MKQYTTPEQTAKLIELGLRSRAQEAERKYQELFNDTPARGAKGRYEKRK